MQPSALTTILDAHGGLDRWRSIGTIDVEMSARGFLFTTKRVPVQHRVHLTIDTTRPHTVLHDYPVPGQQGVLLGHRVEIRAGDTLLQARDDPRAGFSPLPWKPWDAVDFAYFSGYAMWNYLTLPFLLRSTGVEVGVVRDGPDGTVLDVHFPPGIPTHCPVQRLSFDRSGRLVRHDYTAEVVGGWARAVHLCSEYREFDGLWFPTTRRVFPRGPLGRQLPGPTLVAIDIHDVSVR